jgi:uncharacterized protein (TIGR00369 family)
MTTGASDPATRAYDGDPVVPPGFAPMAGSSPFGTLIGPIYERDDAEGFVRAMRLRAEHANLGGVVHGGVLMAFADVILGTVAYRAAGRPGVSIRLVTDFLAPARPGDWLEARARVVRATRSVMFMAGELTVADAVVMTATGTYKLRRPG